MTRQTPPHNFEYHKYLQRILGANKPNTSLFIATEKDFAKGDNLDFPYRSYFYAFGLVHKGNRKIKIGINEYEIKPKALIIIGPGIVRHWMDSNWEASNHTFFFQADFFQPPFFNHFLIDYPFFKPAATHVINLIDTDYEKANGFIRLLQLHSNERKVAQGIFFAFLEFINQIYSVVSTVVGNLTRNQKIVNHFNQLLNSNYQGEKDVSFYANKLNVSSKYLSEILKNETGLSAKQSIEEFILFEAKSLLKQTQMSIKEIVYWLGYEDPSYFTKLFKNREGITPLEYRNQ